MTIFRNIKDGKLYKLYVVSPMKYSGSWLESEDMITGATRKLNASSWKEEDFVAKYYR